MSRAGPRLLGHPVHPMIAGFPVALWVAAAAWDALALLSADPLWPKLAFWTLALGLLAALPAAATGLWELVSLPEDHPAERVVWWHMGAVSAALCCFLGSALLRWPSLEAKTVPWPALLLSAAGVVLTLAGGWLGGELVFRHGLAVEKHTVEGEETG